MKNYKWVILFVFMLTATIFCGCEEHITHDTKAKLQFSVDTLRFDTVFTQQGSITHKVMIYNRNKEAVEIDYAKLNSNSNFQINIDGQSDPDALRNILIRGGDSLFMFVKATINPLDSNSPVLVEDSVVFAVNGNRQILHLEAIGQDVNILRGETWDTAVELGGNKPYLVFDTIIAQAGVTIKAGTRFYMHDNAVIFFLSDLIVNGTLEEPVIFRGDRFDNILRDIPYDYSSGKWGGLFLLHTSNKLTPPTYNINYLDVHSGTVGLFCQSQGVTFMPTLRLNNSRLHNFSLYGLVVQNMNAEVVNTEITNCAGYCVYLAGGKHTFVHNTIANYFNFKKENVSIHSVSREDVAAVYISDLSKNQIRTQTTFINNIITGWRSQNITFATALPNRYDGVFKGNLLRNDTLLFAPDSNTYIQDNDTIFNRTYFSREENSYYDFRLDSVSVARDIADSLLALPYSTDRNGNNRFTDLHPDVGCYEWLPNND